MTSGALPPRGANLPPMSGVVILQGPQAPPDAPLGFCMVCSAVGKYQALNAVKADVEKHERHGQGVARWVLAIPKEYLQRAVAWSVVPAFSVAGPVCWSHLIALQPTGGIIPVQGLPPGLNGGQGIPLLGQGPPP